MNHFKKTNKKLEKLRGVFFQLGLIIACGLSFLAFEWTFPIKMADLGGVIIEEIEEDYFIDKKFEIIEDRVKEEKIQKPKVDLTKIEIVKNDHKEKIEETTEETPEKKEEFNSEKWGEVEEVKEVAPLPFAERMPHYKDCKSLNEKERKKCTQEKMYKHFGKKMRIPGNIKMRGKATYLAFVYFEVNKKGEITNVKILNDKDHEIPRELEREAYNAVSSLPQLIPAKNNGKKVKVLYKVPIKFTIK